MPLLEEVTSVVLALVCPESEDDAGTMETCGVELESPSETVVEGAAEALLDVFVGAVAFDVTAVDVDIVLLEVPGAELVEAWVTAAVLVEF